MVTKLRRLWGWLMFQTLDDGLVVAPGCMRAGIYDWTAPAGLSLYMSREMGMVTGEDGISLGDGLVERGFSVQAGETVKVVLLDYVREGDIIFYPDEG